MQPQPSAAGAASPFAIDQARLAEARQLPGPCYEDFLRLSRTLIHGPPFQWLLVEAPDERLRRQVMAALERPLRLAGLSSNRMTLNDGIVDVAMLEARLERIARSAPVAHVICRPGWFDQERWQAFNTRRERLAARARARLVFWLDADALALASRAAPDLWAWRSGIYAFVAPAALSLEGGGLSPFAVFRPVPAEVDPRSMAEKSRRVSDIRTWLLDHPEAPDELLVGPVIELGELLFGLGDLDAALGHWREKQLPLWERLGSVRGKAVTLGQIADVLQARGQLDEALRIRREEELPVYERLGDLRAQAITMGKIADVEQAHGQLDEALRIRSEKQLPVYMRLGDLREQAITLGQIADVLQARGQLQEALRIRQQEELPVFARLGDQRTKAVTLGKIATVLQALGQLEEALRIRREEVLPVFERLGDDRARATTLGEIADGLRARGQLQEALHLLQAEVLPVFERLGLEPDKAAALAQIQRLRQQLDQADPAH
ncbi:MAG: tetratricopeptide repeat protein [Synechococcaceae cyanobacterium]